MKKLLLALFIIGFHWPIYAQIPGDPFTVQGPNAASLGQYGEVPVSLFTGLPNIGVPLYSVQEGKINIPLSLSYHASGFRPDVHPGWVGMGWNLNAGGAINRTVHDEPDDYYNPNSRKYGTAGYYYFHNILNRNDWYTANVLAGVAQGPNMNGDTEPDEFSFNFIGYSGKFYLNSDGSWKVKCDKPLTIRSNVPNQTSSFQDVPLPFANRSQSQIGASKTFAGFTITTEDGTEYVFGGSNTSIEYEMNIFDQNEAEWVANSWNLTQIIRNDGRKVVFTYERDNNEYVAQMYLGLRLNMEKRTVSTSGVFGSFLDPKCSDPSQPSSIGSYVSGKIISPVYLSAIKTTLANIYFDRLTTTELRYNENIFAYRYDTFINSPNHWDQFMPFLQGPNLGGTAASLGFFNSLQNLKWKKLSAIRVVSNLSSQTVKEFAFNYNDVDTERLTLLKVTEKGVNGVAKLPYRFGYNKYHSLPPYMASMHDHWGFYNAQLANFAYNAHYASRESNPDSAVYLAGILKKIVYPMGGVTDFLYEQHTYGKQLEENRFNPPVTVNGNAAAGGLRIRKITSYSLDNPQQKLEKEYFYVTGYSPTNTSPPSSSGVLGGRVRYFFDDFRAQSFNNSNIIYTQKTFSVQSVLPASSNSQGSHIGYSAVVEKLSDGSYTEYKYSNFDTGNLDDAPLAVLQQSFQNTRTIYSPYSSTEEERGKLLQETLFNNAGQRVKQRNIQYVAFNKSSEFVPVMMAEYAAVCPGNASLIDFGSTYKFYTYSYLPIQETETTYDTQGLNGISTSKNYTYNGYRLLQTRTVTDSKNQVLTTTYRYPFDILTSNGTTPSQPLTNPVAEAIRSMSIKNMIGLPIETITTRNGTTIEASVQTYRLNQQNTSSILPDQYFSLAANQPLSQYTPTTYGVASTDPLIIAGGIPQMQLKATVERYDDKGNLLGLTREGVISSYLWGYSKTLPIAEAANAAANEIFFDSFEEQLGGWDGGLIYESQRPNNPASKAAHAGKLAGRLTSWNDQDQMHSFSKNALTIVPGTKKYIFSGWVYTDGPQGDIWLFQNRQQDVNSDGSINFYGPLSLPNGGDYLARVSVNTIGKWVYIEQEVTIQGDATKLSFRLTNWARAWMGNFPGNVWFDDVRIHPADAQMTTYTQEPLVGVSSISDVNSKPTSYEYDELSRPSIVRDQDGNITKYYQYQYKRQ